MSGKARAVEKSAALTFLFRKDDNMAKIDMPTSSLNQTGQEPKKKLEKVTTGKVTVRQQTDIQKVASAFLAEDLATVKERIINDYAIPMLKNGIWSIFSSALSLMIFGEDKSRSQSSNYVRGSSNSYDRYYSNPNRNQPVNQRVIPNWQNLISDSRADMEEILDQMWEAIREYGQVSIGDLYDLAGMTCNFTDNKYGWKDLTGAYIKNVPGGYSIVFPKPVPLT